MAEPTFQYQRYSAKKVVMLCIGVVVCLLGFVLNLVIGSSEVTASEVIEALLHPDAVSPLTKTIAWDIRLPVAAMAVLVGASLGVAGAAMQTILNNPLASPYTLGVSAGAGVGASIAMLTGMGSLAVLGSYLIPTAAFIFALLACFGIYLISKFKRFTSEVMVLAGIGMVFFFQALQSFLQYVATPEALQGIVFWTFGSLARSNLTAVTTLLVVFVVSFIMVYAKSWQLTAIKFGDEKAKALGVNVERLRMLMFVYISLLTATAVAFVGSIGFIGIVGPHVARMLIGEDQRYYLPMSAISGAVLLCFASIAAKVVVPGAVFPIGILTAIIGVPFFFALILRKKR